MIGLLTWQDYPGISIEIDNIWWYMTIFDERQTSMKHNFRYNLPFDEDAWRSSMEDILQLKTTFDGVQH